MTKNALKFSYRQEVKIKACFSPYRQLLIVHVTDTGRGIEKGEMHKLFSLFGKLEVQGDSENEINSEGIGMGLFICK